jgi:hypothetical protein
VGRTGWPGLQAGGGFPVDSTGHAVVPGVMTQGQLVNHIEGLLGMVNLRL